MDKMQHQHLENDRLSYEYILSGKDFGLTREQKQQATERLRETDVALKVLTNPENFSNFIPEKGASILKAVRPQERNYIKYNLCYLNSAMEVMESNPELLQHAQIKSVQGNLRPYQEAHLKAIETFLAAKKSGQKEGLEDLMEDVRLTLIPAGYADMNPGEAVNSQQDASSVIRFWLDLFMPEQMEVKTSISGKINAIDNIDNIEFEKESTTISSGVIQVKISNSLVSSLEEYFSQEGESLEGYKYEGNSTKDVKKKEVLLNAPDTLFIQVKRTLWDEGQNRAVRSNSSIELPQEGSLSLNKETYQIDSVICQKGGASVGHYVTYKKIDNAWFLCDNYKSTPVKYKDIPSTDVVMVGLKACK